MIAPEILTKAYSLMATAKAMTEIYEANRQACPYVFSTSRGHEAIQIATGLQLLSCDFVSPYYRDDALLLAVGFEPYELMLQLLAKADDIFSGGRTYYSHPSFKGNNKPTIIHQSSATGMQAIPATGVAQGIQYLQQIHSSLLLKGEHNELPVVVCSLGDGSMAEGEVSEAFQFASFKQLPILFLVQDNGWAISATAAETRLQNAYEFANGFKGLKKFYTDGSHFQQAFMVMQEAFHYVRQQQKPAIVHAEVPLLSHHTSGVRKEFYRSREDWEEHEKKDPFPILHNILLQQGFEEAYLTNLQTLVSAQVKKAFQKALHASEPVPSSVEEHILAATPIQKETGTRTPAVKNTVFMVDAAVHAIAEIMEEHEECILYGQDVGKRLGGVFREAAVLGEKFGSLRVFNTAIQEAYIIGSTVGLSAVGVKPIVEVQFADYIFPGINQLITEISKSNYLSNGKFPIQMVLRVPIGAYGGGGPYHSASIESLLLTIKGIKICYPSNAADMKGLMKAAFYDPNPVIMLEHKGLYWSKVPGTETAKTIEPYKDYILPMGKANIVLQANEEKTESGETAVVITYGMGVYWAKEAAAHFEGNIEIIDLRTLYPLDEFLVFERVKKHGRCLVLTEEPQNNSFAEALAHRITYNCFQFLDTKVEVMGALNLPAVPLNVQLEQAMLPNAKKVYTKLQQLLNA